MLSLPFSILLFSSSYVVKDRRQAAQGEKGGYFFFFVCGKRGTGLEGEGERLRGVLRRSKVYDGGVVLQVLQV